MHVTLKIIDEIVSKLAKDHPDLPEFAVYLEAQTQAQLLAHEASNVVEYKFDYAVKLLRFRMFPAASLTSEEVERGRAAEIEQIGVVRNALLANRRAELYRQMPQRLLDLGVSEETATEYIEAWSDFLRFMLP